MLNWVMNIFKDLNQLGRGPLNEKTYRLFPH